MNNLKKYLLLGAVLSAGSMNAASFDLSSDATSSVAEEQDSVAIATDCGEACPFTTEQLMLEKLVREALNTGTSKHIGAGVAKRLTGTVLCAVLLFAASVVGDDCDCPLALLPFGCMKSDVSSFVVMLQKKPAAAAAEGSDAAPKKSKFDLMNLTNHPNVAAALGAFAPLMLLIGNLFESKDQSVESFEKIQEYAERLTPRQRANLAGFFKSEYMGRLQDKLLKDKGSFAGKAVVGLFDIALVAGVAAFVYFVQKYSNEKSGLKGDLAAFFRGLTDKESKDGSDSEELPAGGDIFKVFKGQNYCGVEDPRAVRLRAVYITQLSAFVAVAMQVLLVAKNLYFTADHKKAAALKTVEVLLK